jgi:hypothetical protein
MRLRVALLVMSVGLLAIAAERSLAAVWNDELIKSGEVFNFAGVSAATHTWSDVWKSGGQSFSDGSTSLQDIVCNFSPVHTSFCASSSSTSGCSWDYSSVSYVWRDSPSYSTHATWYNQLYNQYARGANLTYGVTGVCHQAANRANYFMAVPWIDGNTSPGISGGATSYALYCHCGAGVACYSCDL